MDLVVTGRRVEVPFYVVQGRMTVLRAGNHIDEIRSAAQAAVSLS